MYKSIFRMQSTSENAPGISAPVFHNDVVGKCIKIIPLRWWCQDVDKKKNLPLFKKNIFAPPLVSIIKAYSKGKTNYFFSISIFHYIIIFLTILNYYLLLIIIFCLLFLNILATRKKKCLHNFVFE